jgi:uncharacterized protein
MRSLASVLSSRENFAGFSGMTFEGRRSLYQALGYKQVLKPADYWARYERGGIAQRLVEAFPQATWRGGGELVEDEDPDVETEFEKAFNELNERHKLWSLFLRTDILAGLGRYAVILIGAPGDFAAPLVTCKPEDLAYLQPFSERDVTIVGRFTDRTKANYGFPEYYGLKVTEAGQFPNSRPKQTDFAGKVHCSRIIHFADGVLDHPLFGKPRLRAVWNDLDNLDKVVGAGSEAFWKRVDGGKQIDIDPTVKVKEGQIEELQRKLEAYTDGNERMLTTSGVKITDLGTSVTSFNANVSSILDLISATSSIPQRILMGSERGQLASTSDETNFDDRVSDRRDDVATVGLVRPTIDRLIELKTLPTPKEYAPRWPEVDDLDEAGKMDLANKACDANQKLGKPLMTRGEIRDRILGLPPIEEIEDYDPEDDEPVVPVINADPNADPNAPPLPVRKPKAVKPVPKAASTVVRRLKSKRERFVRLSVSGKDMPRWAKVRTPIEGER